MTARHKEGRKNLAGPVYERIKADIFDFRLLPGTRFSENEVASRARVSRTPVREALFRLEREGYLEVHPKSGWSVRALALSSAGRYPLLPEVPTVGETLKGVEFSSWLGLAVSPGTPRATIDRLNGELRAILAEPDTKERFAGFGGVPAYSTPEAMRQRVEREIARWQRVVETRGIERQ